MMSFQGKVIFAAEEPSSGRELWITDGNSSGTRLLADFCPGTCSSSPLPLGTAHSLLFGLAFPNSDSTFAESGYLWRSDGTRQGTYLLPDPSNPLALPFTSKNENPTARRRRSSSAPTPRILPLCNSTYRSAACGERTARPREPSCSPSSPASSLLQSSLWWAPACSLPTIRGSG